MSVKPGQTSKRTISKADGISNTGGVGSETMNPPSPVEYGRFILNYATDYTDTTADDNGSHLY